MYWLLLRRIFFEFDIHPKYIFAGVIIMLQRMRTATKTCLQNQMLMKLLIKSKFVLNKNCSQTIKFLTENQNFYRIFLHVNSTQNLLTAEICFQQRRITSDGKACRLGWINNVAKILSSCKFEHVWREISVNALERIFAPVVTKSRLRTISIREWFALSKISSLNFKHPFDCFY